MRLNGASPLELIFVPLPVTKKYNRFNDQVFSRIGPGAAGI